LYRATKRHRNGSANASDPGERLRDRICKGEAIGDCALIWLDAR
jgi:hypothetical protein